MCVRIFYVCSLWSTDMQCRNQSPKHVYTNIFFSPGKVRKSAKILVTTATKRQEKIQTRKMKNSYICAQGFFLMLGKTERKHFSKQ